MRITVDPETDASGFGYAAPGRYTLRIAKAPELMKKDYPYLKWSLEFVDPNVQSADPATKKVGGIFENTTLKTGDNAQFRLRQLCEALGLKWGDFDTDTTIGMTLEADVDIREYNGKFSNTVKRFIPKGK